jgi:hypothetical protein
MFTLAIAQLRAGRWRAEHDVAGSERLVIVEVIHLILRYGVESVTGQDLAFLDKDDARSNVDPIRFGFAFDCLRYRAQLTITADGICNVCRLYPET